MKSKTTLLIIFVNIIISWAIWENSIYVQQTIFTFFGFSSNNLSIYTPVSYAFLHANKEHLLFNMFFLLIFGIPLERVINSENFLKLYFFR